MPKAEDVVTPGGVRLGDMSNDRLAELIGWCEDHRGEKADALRDVAEEVYDARLEAAWIQYHSPF